MFISILLEKKWLSNIVRNKSLNFYIGGGLRNGTGEARLLLAILSEFFSDFPVSPDECRYGIQSKALVVIFFFPVPRSVVAMPIND